MTIEQLIKQFIDDFLDKLDKKDIINKKFTLELDRKTGEMFFYDKGVFEIDGITITPSDNLDDGMVRIVMYDYKDIKFEFQKHKTVYMGNLRFNGEIDLEEKLTYQEALDEVQMVLERYAIEIDKPSEKLIKAFNLIKDLVEAQDERDI